MPSKPLDYASALGSNDHYPGSRMNRYLFACMMLGLLCRVASVQGAETQEVFKRFQDRIVQIRILESSSGSRVELGSGFRVSRTGEIITNYHVISKLVDKPQQYRAEVVYFDGHATALKLLNFDAVRDLAIVSGDARSSSFFDLYALPLPQGTRVFSIGTPLDLGFTIVEGTYNGLLENSQYEKIHFTGSINPGMSGGPAILGDGRVIGVNVATAGNQVSFLVPAKFVIALLRQTQGGENTMPFLEKLAAQLQENQKYFMAQLMSSNMDTVNLGAYALPGKIAPYLKCWGDDDRNPDDLFVRVSHFCSSEDDLFVSDSHLIHFLNFRHDYLTSDELGQRRFFNLYQQYFANDSVEFEAGKEDVTKFACQTDFVAHANLTMRTVLCLRAYKKLPGLYDAVLKLAVLGNGRRGVLSTMQLGGVSYDNALLFSRKYLESIAWKK
jgi:serine protease Do